MRATSSAFVAVVAAALLSAVSNGFHLAPASIKPIHGAHTSVSALFAEAATMPKPKEATKTKPPSKKIKGQQRKNTQGTAATKSSEDNKKKNRPKSRQARNKKFLMKKWKSQQADQKRRQQERQEKKQGGKTELVSAIGVDLSTIQRRSEDGSRNKSAPKLKKKKKMSATITFNEKKTKTQGKNGKKKNKRRPWTTLQPGYKVSGKVIKLFPYGALVQIHYDIPGKTKGCVLLHESQIPKNSKKLEVGQPIQGARVVSINRELGIVNISLLPPAGARATRIANLRVGDEVQGKVVRLKQYGAFVDCGLKRNALLHLSRMSMYKVNNITDHVQVGQVVNVRILRMNEGDIAVSMLSKDNDDFVDRRDLQRKRMAIWDTVINAQEDDELANAKKELMEVDRQIWDNLVGNNDKGPKTGEV